MKTENLTKAAQGADMLVADLQDAYSDAVRAGDQFAIIVLLELLGAARQLNQKLGNALCAAENVAEKAGAAK